MKFMNIWKEITCSKTNEFIPQKNNFEMSCTGLSGPAMSSIIGPIMT